MRTAIFGIIVGVGLLIRFIGGLGLFGLLIYGIYMLFAKSVIVGLILIGASVVGAWIIHFVSGLIMLCGVGAASIGAKNFKDK